jgi:hypothetical protein
VKHYATQAGFRHGFVLGGEGGMVVVEIGETVGIKVEALLIDSS